MANLTQFLGLKQNSDVQFLAVFNTNTDSSQNGGRCCLYTVPGAGVRTIFVEMWGSGGDGSGACCCQWPYTTGSAGQYVVETINVSPGDALTICAGGSGCFTCSCCGTCGFPSFITRSSTIIMCASGGQGSCGLCFYKTFNCTGICVPGIRTNVPGCGDLVVCSNLGMSVTHNFCASDMFEASPGSSKYNQNMRIGHNYCSTPFTISGCNRFPNHFPGGPGAGGSACGNPCCWGGYGAGGLVLLTLYG